MEKKLQNLSLRRLVDFVHECFFLQKLLIYILSKQINLLPCFYGNIFSCINIYYEVTLRTQMFSITKYTNDSFIRFTISSPKGKK